MWQVNQSGQFPDQCRKVWSMGRQSFVYSWCKQNRRLFGWFHFCSIMISIDQYWIVVGLYNHDFNNSFVIPLEVGLRFFVSLCCYVSYGPSAWNKMDWIGSQFIDCGLDWINSILIGLWCLLLTERTTSLCSEPSEVETLNIRYSKQTRFM